MILATTQPCVAHKRHTPVPTYCELHHVIPQAWQAVWAPEGVEWTVSPGGAAVGRLWDSRTLALCPTGHRNVHYWLVRLMKAIPREQCTSPDADEDLLGTAQSQVRRIARDAKTPHVPGAKELEIASMAIERITDQGGTLALATLIDAKQWGEA